MAEQQLTLGGAITDAVGLSPTDTHASAAQTTPVGRTELRGGTGSESGGVTIVILLMISLLGAYLLGVQTGPTVKEWWEASANTSSTSSTSSTTAPARPPFAEALDQARLSVMRLDSVVCDADSSGVGTGFLIAPRLLATAGHVVDSAATIYARNDEEVRVARVIGRNETRDLALLELDRPIPGQPFKLADRRAERTTRVGALGYPLGRGLLLTEGAITAYDGKESSDGRALTDLIQTDAAINPGNSGGPLITRDGTVVGIVVGGLDYAEGFSFAVDAMVAAPLLQKWAQSPEPPQPVDCPDPVVPSEGVGVETNVSGRTAAEISVALGIHFRALNNGQYKLAWQQYSARKRSEIPIEKLSSETKSSQTENWLVQSLRTEPDGAVIVHFSFQSTQDAGEGPSLRPDETCTQWSNDYRMVLQEGRWVIDRVTGHAGASPNAPCEEAENE